jgi:hypothetical protein
MPRELQLHSSSCKLTVAARSAPDTAKLLCMPSCTQVLGMMGARNTLLLSCHHDAARPRAITLEALEGHFCKRHHPVTTLVPGTRHYACTGFSHLTSQPNISLRRCQVALSTTLLPSVGVIAAMVLPCNGTARLPCDFSAGYSACCSHSGL